MTALDWQSEEEDLSRLEANPFAEEVEPRPVVFRGLRHAEVLAMPLPEEGCFLIEDLIPAGAVGTIAGVPETGKSWLAQSIAVQVAAGVGRVLDRDVVQQTAVGYFWQDDSTRSEIERVQLFAAVHNTPNDLRLRWFMNERLTLPEDLNKLKATISHFGLGLVVLDSFYNVAPADGLKDDAAETIVAALKRDIADETGCTVLIVDHMPWATEVNRGRLRAYGGVFKAAATRFGIYIDAVGSKLWIEARGNNLHGFKRTSAYWDPGALELRLVEVDTGQGEDVEKRAETVLAWLTENPGAHSKTAIRKAVRGRHKVTDQALELLQQWGSVRNLSASDGTNSDRVGNGKGWIATVHAGSESLETQSLIDGTGSDSLSAVSRPVQPVPSPIGGQGWDGTTSGDELE